MGCLYVEIEGQSCLVDNVVRGLMKISQIDHFGRMTKKEPEKYFPNRFFTIATMLAILQQKTIPETSFKASWSNYRLSISTGLTHKTIQNKSDRNREVLGWRKYKPTN